VPITKPAQKQYKYTRQNTKETKQNKYVENKTKEVLGQKTITLTKHR
jgi:hypothetical protein